MTVWLIPFGAPLQGQVLDAGGKPVANAAVSLVLPDRGEASIALATERVLTSAVPIPGWRGLLLECLTWSATSDVDGFFSLAAVPGTTVEVLARTGTHHARAQVVVPRDASPVPPLRLAPGRVDEPAAPRIPQIRPVPPGGRVAFTVEDPSGRPVAARVELRAGNEVLHRAELTAGESVDWPAPARTTLTLELTTGPGKSVRGRALTFRLKARDRLWLGALRMPRGPVQ